MTWIDAIRKENGSVIQFGNEAKIIIGKDGISESLEHDLIYLSNIINSKNIQFEYTNDIRKAVWEKLIMVASIGSIMCYSNMDAKNTVNDKSYLKILEGMITEMTNASISIGVNIDKNYAKDTLRYILDRSENLHSSLKEDFDHNRPLELDQILGEAYRTGINNNVDMPNCKLVYEKLIKFVKV